MTELLDFVRFVLGNSSVSEILGEGLLLLLGVLGWALFVSPRIRPERNIRLTRGGVSYPRGFEREVIPWSDIAATSTFREADRFTLFVELRPGGSRCMSGPRSKQSAQVLAAEILYYAENPDARSVLPADTGEQPRAPGVPAHALAPYLERAATQSRVETRDALIFVAKVIGACAAVCVTIFSLGFPLQYAIQGGMIAGGAYILWLVRRR